MKRKRLNAEEMLEQAYDQMMEDRDAIKASYEKFSEQMETLEHYAVNGQNINKCLELMTKQTQQMLEMVKMQGGGSKKEEDMSVDDIYSQLKKDSTIDKDKRS